MLELVLHPDLFNLLRIGRKRAILHLGVHLNPAGQPDLGPAVIVNEANEKMRAEVLIHRVVYLAIEELTTEDAKANGFMNVDQLFSAMREHDPTVSVVDQVTIYYFRRTDRESG